MNLGSIFAYVHWGRQIAGHDYSQVTTSFVIRQLNVVNKVVNATLKRANMQNIALIYGDLQLPCGCSLSN